VNDDGGWGFVVGAIWRQEGYRGLPFTRRSMKPPQAKEEKRNCCKYQKDKRENRHDESSAVFPQLF
jgi:hypothetical protein